MDKMMQTKSIASSRNKMMQHMVKSAVLAASLVVIPTLADAADRVMSFAVSGVVADVSVKAGQTVKEGQVLARLEGAAFAANVAAAKDALAAASLELKFSADAEARARQLFEDLSTSAEEVERSQLRHATANAAVSAAKAQLTKATWEAAKAVLRAPSGGTVVKVPGFKGQAVAPAAGVQPVVVLSGK